MKKLVSLLLSLFIFAQTAAACDEKRCYYATACTIDFCLFIKDDTVGAIKVENAAHAAGDTYLMKDGGAEANTTNGFTDEGSCYSEVLTATETTTARGLLNIEDQGTKTWSDKCIAFATIARTAADNGLAAFSYPTVDVASISGDATAPDALEAMLDGTGATLSLNHLDIIDTTGDAVNISTAGGNGDGIEIAANGSGSGIKTTAGATGSGILSTGGATSGNAILATSPASSGLSLVSGGNGNALLLTGSGTGSGLAATGGATGHGFILNGGATSGDGIHVAVTSGDGFEGSINGNITGNLSGSIGSFGAGAITASSFGAGAIDAAAIGADAIGSSELAATAGTELGTASWASATRQLTGTQAFSNTGTWTGDITGDLTGDVTGNVTGSVGSVVGAVGSVTGNVGGNVTGTVGTLGVGAIATSTFAVGAIDASAIAANALGASELATDAATEIATAVGSGITLGAGAITSSTFASGAIDAAAIAPDAIGSSELAATAATEVATAVGSGITLGAGAITSATFASGAIDAAAIAPSAIGSSEIANDAIDASEIAAGSITVSEAPNLDAAISSISGGGGGTDELSSGTAQGATITTLRLASAENYGTNALADNASVVITAATTGKGQTRCIKANNTSTDTVTLTSYWNITPTGVITYSIRATPNCNPAKWHTN